MTDLVAAEWLKLRTTRVLHGMLPAAVAISSAAVLESTEGIRRVLPVTGTGALLVLVVGIIISAGEFRHGTAPDTFLTTPRRHQVVVAKLAVGAGVGLGAGAVISLVGLGVASLLYSVEGVTFPLDDAEVWLILAGAMAYSALFALIGVALGVLVRNQALAISGALAWFAVVEHTLVNLAPDIGRWLPAAAGLAIVRTHLDGLLSPVGGTAVLVVYGTAIALAGIRVMATRDV